MIKEGRRARRRIGYVPDVKARLPSIAMALVVATACTSFDGLEPSVGGAPPGSGGAGGQPPEGPRALLPLLDAANLCSLVFRCPTLGGSILLSTGLPLVQTDAEARPIVWNYSACIDWLTAPLEAGRVGFDSLREIVLLVAPAATCEQAAALLPFDVAEDPVALCGASTEDLCDGADAVACPEGVTAHCEGQLFAPTSKCEDPMMGARGCSLGTCSAPEVRCDPDEPYVVECTASGLNVVFSCDVYGLSCQAPAGCVASSGPTTCTTLGEQRCADGDRRARACAIRKPSGGLLAAEVECNGMAMTCAEEAGSARCMPPKASCSPYDVGQNQCQGNTAIVCVQGAETAIDCGLLGKTCVGPSMDGSKTAHCE